jgi:hypothetical protein
VEGGHSQRDAALAGVVGARLSRFSQTCGEVDSTKAQGARADDAEEGSLALRRIAQRIGCSPRLDATPAGMAALREPEDLSDDERKALRQMQGVCDDVAAAYPLAQQFVGKIRAREAEAFDPWLEAAERSGVADLQSFASELRQERKAVQAALMLPYSNGQTEGQINKLKLIKRSMYGLVPTSICCVSASSMLVDANSVGEPLQVSSCCTKSSGEPVFGEQVTKAPRESQTKLGPSRV